jgi:hypothetical protein
MAKKAEKGPQGSSRGAGLAPRSGDVTATFRVETEELAALQREAMKRAAARGSLKADASEVLCKAVGTCLGQRR